MIIECVAIAVAYDAWRIATREVEKNVRESPPPPGPIEAAAGLNALIPMGLGGVFVAGYVGLTIVGATMQDYTKIDRSAEVIEQTDEGHSYENSFYGVEMRIPSEWQFVDSEEGTIVSAELLLGVCSANLIPESHFPLYSLEFFSASLQEQLGNVEYPLVSSAAKDGSLAGLPARQIDIVLDVDGNEVNQHYISVKKGTTVYTLVGTISNEMVDQCGDDLAWISERLVLSK